MLRDVYDSELCMVYFIADTRRKQRSKAGQTSGIPEATQENGGWEQFVSGTIIGIADNYSVTFGRNSG